jgi:hypothetical protein
MHKAILKSIGEHLDDLKVRNPRVYEQEERVLKMQDSRLGYEVAQAPVGVKEWEKTR